ncbi:MAG TPA: DUF262 domain-containing protein [Blastocatellia bacterium]
MSAAVDEELETEALEDIVDEAVLDDTVPPERYDITSFGADYDVDGIVRRLKRGDIFVPAFQRDYVWKIPEASRFIESLLLGLPVPGIFLAREQESNKLLVIDGQQRLKTLEFFYNGIFDPKPDQKTQRVFALTKVQPEFEGLTYDTLSERDRIKLDDSIIHATVVKQDAPRDDDTSIYHIFERLNNGGRRLTPQEIRTALYHGPLIDLLKSLNEHEVWRQVFGPKNARLKDQELILRFLALYLDHEHYEKPMVEFLNKFSLRHRMAEADFLDHAALVFRETIDVIWKAFGAEAFRPERSLNAAVFDSVMVGVAFRLKHGPIEKLEGLHRAYSALFEDADYRSAVSYSTSNEASVETRVRKAIEAFATL